MECGASPIRGVRLQAWRDPADPAGYGDRTMCSLRSLHDRSRPAFQPKHVSEDSIKPKAFFLDLALLRLAHFISFRQIRRRGSIQLLRVGHLLLPLLTHRPPPERSRRIRYRFGAVACLHWRGGVPFIAFSVNVHHEQ